MKFLIISLISRLILMLAFPAVALAFEKDIDASNINAKEKVLTIIEDGKMKPVYSDEYSRSFSIFNNVLKNQPELEESGLSVYSQKVKSYSRVSVLEKNKKTIKILATGYSSTVDQCDGDPFTTASGTHVHKGTLACPPEYPFGTKVEIDFLGTFVCEDRGGAIKGNHFDIWFETRAQALNWGKRLVSAEIIFQ